LTKSIAVVVFLPLAVLAQEPSFLVPEGIRQALPMRFSRFPREMW
jgi:hypothetical protein